ncbi:DNA-formamidopyrimidine glycosylase family protein [Agromyces mangrovi Wang et al. 2018]|uniref:DNA-formamidopyrimidine glycosylase family protein n=1 Tax=Agromyces mangrovi TaxID=1858653 RepID=UPI0025745A83|nr:DNA-formamidopyrimidine glycosylase family protein [Agromyces mangrovi]BDZ65491.1 formamidopyrimidine-DNA glycosylase [Agromyces mangrovi]
MPESPEVQALAEEVGARLAGRSFADADVLEFRVQKTRARPLSSLVGERVDRVERHGKLLDVAFANGAHLVVSLGRHGWARWGGADAPESTDASEKTDASETTGALEPASAPTAPDPAEPPPPALAALTFDDGSTLELTDAGGWVSLGCWVVDDPHDVPAVAKLGPDPADPAYDRDDFDRAFGTRRKQVKAVLQEQESIAGIGNAYSDEILHAARVSPVVHAAALDDDERDRLFAATVEVVREAIAARRGIRIADLKAAKVAAMRVHGRAGDACPRCGDEIRDFTFASTTAQYSPTCQTGGEVLPLRDGGD